MLQIHEEALKQYIISLYQDIPNTVYLLLGVVLGLGLVILRANSCIKDKWRAVLILLMVEYVFLIYSSTVVFRLFTENVSHNFTPFWTYDEIKGGIMGLIPVVVMNIIVFLPIGFLGTYLLGLKRCWVVLLFGFGISISIELLQFVFSRGSAEFDDIFHNTIGCLFGIIIFALNNMLLSLCRYMSRPRVENKRLT